MVDIEDNNSDEEDNVLKSGIEFIRKEEFMERKKDEAFIVAPIVESKLKDFFDNEVMALEFSINSPLTVIDIHKIKDEDVIGFINDRFKIEGLSEKEINESFKQFE